MWLKILVLEGEVDLARRVEVCLQGEGMSIVRGDRSFSAFFDDGGRADAAIISTSVLQDDAFSPADWELAEGIPVLWVGLRQSSPRWAEGKKPQILPLDFSCAQLRARVAQLIPVEKLAAKPAGPEVAETEIIYRSPNMGSFLAEARAYAPIDSSVLIRGETGTGKELVARLVAKGHPRYGKGPFVAVNCGAVPDNLFESLFFGHVKGAFTGAWRNHSGYLADARGGTLYLDEIGDLPDFQQVKLLRVLEESSVMPVGGKETVAVDFRLVAATNRPLRQMIEAGKFRADLYYRIAVIELQVPNLEERGAEDKITLFQHAFAQALGRFRPGDPVPELPDWLGRLVVEKHYPGNVRELLNLATRTAALYAVSGNWCQERCQHFFSPPAVRQVDDAMVLTEQERQERNRIFVALDQNHWRRAETAALLGISRKTLWEKMRKYDLG
jgi:DNA-binding NtrC family response regulator